MTELKKEVVKLIDDLPEEQIQYVIQYIRDISYRAKKEEQNEKMEAFFRLEKNRLHLPDDFDEKEALEEARDEKYGDIN